MVGELVGARLIAHAGSLLSLAKYPASTVQILGAEKALFRALKTKHATPKYGLIYHASVVGQANPKHKGRISRTLASKCSLAVRVDALGDTDEGATVGEEGRLAVEARLRRLEGKADLVISKQSYHNNTDKYTPAKTPGKAYNTANDMVMEPTPKAKIEEVPEVNGKSEDNDADMADENEDEAMKTPETSAKKKKKRKSTDGNDEKSTEKKKKKKKRTREEGEDAPAEEGKKKKKKKSRKSVEAEA